jgi:putative nucleotidyltransferase with HDIG domain
MTLIFGDVRTLLGSHADGAAWTRHAEAVSLVAHGLAVEVARRRTVDLEFVRTAALLHDIGRATTHDPVGHGAEGYRLLLGLGYPSHAFVCASHVLFGLPAEEAALFGLPCGPFIPSTIEQKLVSLADLLVDFDRPTTLTLRFASLRQRYAGEEFFFTRLDRAETTARGVLQVLGEELGASVEALVQGMLEGADSTGSFDDGSRPSSPPRTTGIR